MTKIENYQARVQALPSRQALFQCRQTAIKHDAAVYRAYPETPEKPTGVSDFIEADKIGNYIMTTAIWISPWFVHEIFQHTHLQIITRLAIVHTLKVLILRMQRSFANLVKSKITEISE